MNNKKQYEKPECKKFFREPELTKQSKLHKGIGVHWGPGPSCSACSCGEDDRGCAP